MSKKTVKKSAFYFNVDGSSIGGNQFAGVAYSGGEIKDHWAWGNLVFDCSSISAKEKIAILLNHDPDKIVGFGSVTGGNNITVNGVVSESTESGQQVSSLSKEGMPWQMSVFIEPSSIEELTSGSIYLNGQTFQAPLTIFRNSEIREVSFTPVGADKNTSAYVFNEQGDKEVDIEIKKIEQEIAQNQENQQEQQEPVKTSTENETQNQNSDKQFDCGCGCNGDPGGCGQSQDGSNELQKKIDELLKQNSKLEEELKAYKNQEKFSAVKSKLEKTGQSFDDETVSKFSKLDDESLDLFISSLSKVSEKRNLNPELFSKKETQSFSVDIKDPKALIDAAKKYMAQKQGVTFDKAIEEITLLNGGKL